MPLPESYPKETLKRNVVTLNYGNKTRDCNPGLEFSIPGFGIVVFPIPGSRDPVGIGVVQLKLLKLPRGLRYLDRYF